MTTGQRMEARGAPDIPTGVDAPTLAGFGPDAALTASLWPHLAEGRDGAHDAAHIGRVWANVSAIQAAEGGCLRTLQAACLLHDCVGVEKADPLRAQASRLSAERAAAILRAIGWPAPRVAAACHAILAHSFSAGIDPATLEARILQDADRLDAIGAIGIARCFYTGGRVGSALYHPTDPDARNRPLDDRRYALDHFPAKLLGLARGFRTATGRRMAEERHARMLGFLHALRDEAGLPPQPC